MKASVNIGQSENAGAALRLRGARSTPSGGTRPARSTWARKNEQSMLRYVLPALIVLLAVIAYPFVYGAVVSLQSWNLESGVRYWVGLGNYASLFGSGALWHSLEVTAIYTGVGVAAELVFGLALALVIREGIRRGLRGIQAVRVLLLLPVAIAPLIWGFYFSQLMDPSFGTFDELLRLVHGPQLTWVNGTGSALPSLILVQVWQWTPFMFTLLLGGLLSVPPMLREAASLDGASWFRRLMSIELPVLRPVVIVALLIQIITSLQYLDYVYVLTSGGPGTATNILNYYGFSTGFTQFMMGQAAAIAFVVFGVSVLASLTVLGASGAFGGRVARR